MYLDGSPRKQDDMESSRIQRFRIVYTVSRDQTGKHGYGPEGGKVLETTSVHPSIHLSVGKAVHLLVSPFILQSVHPSRTQLLETKANMFTMQTKIKVSETKIQVSKTEISEGENELSNEGPCGTNLCLPGIFQGPSRVFETRIQVFGARACVMESGISVQRPGSERPESNYCDHNLGPKTGQNGKLSTTTSLRRQHLCFKEDQNRKNV